MRGGVSYEDILNMSYAEKESISKIIEENLETTKNSKLPFFQPYLFIITSQASLEDEQAHLRTRYTRSSSYGNQFFLFFLILLVLGISCRLEAMVVLNQHYQWNLAMTVILCYLSPYNQLFVAITRYRLLFKVQWDCSEAHQIKI